MPHCGNWARLYGSWFLFCCGGLKKAGSEKSRSWEIKVRRGIFIALLLLSACNVGPLDDHSVSQVDLSRYLGIWYEIASFQPSFQRGCVCTRAQYSLAQGYVRVKNSCRIGTKTGRLKEASARAYPVPASQNSRLKVQFVWPFKGDYWVIGLDPDYRWALVGHPRRKYLWILARTPRIDRKLYDRLVALAQSKGYDTGRLIKTDQSCWP